MELFSQGGVPANPAEARWQRRKNGLASVANFELSGTVYYLSFRTRGSSLAGIAASFLDGRDEATNITKKKLGKKPAYFRHLVN